MSKRSGNYITMREVLKEVGIDNLRFMMISRNADKSIDFDFESVIKKIKITQFFMCNMLTLDVCPFLILIILD